MNKPRVVGYLNLTQDQLNLLQSFISKMFSEQIILHEITTKKQLILLCKQHKLDALILGETKFKIDTIEIVKQLNLYTLSVIIFLTESNDNLVLSYYKNGALDCLTSSEIESTSLQDSLLKSFEKSDFFRKRRKENEKTQYIAFHDHLTGLPNRLFFNQIFTKAISLHRRHLRIFAICMLDLDGFKAVNDNFGHNAGDLLLKKVSKIFLKSIRKSDFIARFGGDEFALILYEIDSPQDAIIILQNIIDKFIKPITIFGKKVQITTSIGVSIFDGSNNSPSELLQRADKALLNAKKEGKNKFKFFDHLINEQISVCQTLSKQIESQVSEMKPTIFLSKYTNGQEQLTIVKPRFRTKLIRELGMMNYHENPLVSKYFKVFVQAFENSNMNGLIEIGSKIIEDKSSFDLLLSSNLRGVILDPLFLTEGQDSGLYLTDLFQKKQVYLLNYAEVDLHLDLFEKYDISGVIINSRKLLSVYKKARKDIFLVIHQLSLIYSFNVVVLAPTGDEPPSSSNFFYQTTPNL